MNGVVRLPLITADSPAPRNQRARGCLRSSHCKARAHVVLGTVEVDRVQVHLERALALCHATLIRLQGRECG